MKRLVLLTLMMISLTAEAGKILTPMFRAATKTNIENLSRDIMNAVSITRNDIIGDITYALKNSNSGIIVRPRSIDIFTKTFNDGSELEISVRTTMNSSKKIESHLYILTDNLSKEALEDVKNILQLERWNNIGSVNTATISDVSITDGIHSSVTKLEILILKARTGNLGQKGGTVLTTTKFRNQSSR